MILQIGSVNDNAKFNKCFGHPNYFSWKNAAFLRRTYQLALHIVKFFHVSCNRCSLSTMMAFEPEKKAFVAVFTYRLALLEAL